MCSSEKDSRILEINENAEDSDCYPLINGVHTEHIPKHCKNFSGVRRFLF